ncbi:hypothetical protein HOLleu_40991 [Holothuria leucospilota]|uniref:G-protein coupled receptors family 3 profile domain-containing protein n=1 Tax=Holothuria leucospilota TaxID=206669 RepID=A0A9Q0YDF0_HOLLE|nr:hypothetical protein HOLleu_40991 [Holothuria leucospilota]
MSTLEKLSPFLKVLVLWEIIVKVGILPAHAAVPSEALRKYAGSYFDEMRNKQPFQDGSHKSIKNDEKVRRTIRSPNEDLMYTVINTLNEFESKSCKREFLVVKDLMDGESVLKNVVDFESLKGNASTAVYTANLLSNSLGFNRSQSYAGVYRNKELYFSLVRTNVNTNPSLYGSCVAFDRNSFEKGELFAPCAQGSLKESDLIFEFDMSQGLNYSSSDVKITSWFTNFTSTSVNMKMKSDFLQRRYNTSHYSEKQNIQHAYITEEDGIWTGPYFDCNVTGQWVITFSVPFFDASLQFQGVVTISVALRTIDVNQCEGGTGIFAGSHKCSQSTYCNFTPGKGFKAGAYTCKCKEGYYLSNETDSKTLQTGFDGKEVERQYRKFQEKSPNTYEDFVCLQCAEGCDTCNDSSPCLIEGDMLLRTVILGVQSFCMVLTILLIGMVLKYRTMKVIACDSPWMLIVILLGAFLLYAVILASFMTPNVTSCFMRRWLRGWGFAIAYGMLVLKIYRKLAIFQTRSATRVLVRDRDVLKWLLLILTVLSGYLVAWTVFSVQAMNKCGESIVEISSADDSVDNMKFYVCALKWWDYVIDVIEFLFLLFAIYLCYSVRAAPSEFHETRFITVAVYNEIIMTSIFHVLSHLIWQTTPPDLMFIIMFIHSQLTTTIMVSLIFIPKLVIIHRIMHDAEFRERVNSKVTYDSSDSGGQGKWKNTTFLNKNSGTMVTTDTQNLSPDEIREELRRLYTQLEIYKTKSLRIDNPHLPSKKRGGVSKWRAPRRFSRGHSLRTHSGHSESERSSEIARSNESLTKAVELNDYRSNHRVDGFDHAITGNTVTEGVVTPSQKWP